MFVAFSIDILVNMNLSIGNINLVLLERGRMQDRNFLRYRLSKYCARPLFH